VNIATEFSYDEEDVKISIMDLNTGAMISTKSYDEIPAGTFTENFNLPNNTDNCIYVITIESIHGLLYSDVLQQNY